VLRSGIGGGVIVLGKVRAPGLFPTSGRQHEAQPFVIAQAGGFAGVRHVIVGDRHAAPRSHNRSGDVGAIVKEAEMKRILTLEDGDIVYVGGWHAIKPGSQLLEILAWNYSTQTVSQNAFAYYRRPRY